MNYAFLGSQPKVSKMASFVRERKNNVPEERGVDADFCVSGEESRESLWMRLSLLDTSGTANFT